LQFPLSNYENDLVLYNKLTGSCSPASIFLTRASSGAGIPLETRPDHLLGSSLRTYIGPDRRVSQNGPQENQIYTGIRISVFGKSSGANRIRSPHFLDCCAF